MLRKRLFWQLLATFAVLIVCGVGGTSALTFVSLRQLTARSRLQAVQRIEPPLAAALGDFYSARRNSWTGVDARLEAWLAADARLQAASIGYVVFDQRGQPIARGGATGINFDLVRPAQGTPILVNDMRVGALALVVAGMERPRLVQRAPEASRRIVSEESLDRQVQRMLILVSIGISSAMLGLAVFMSRRISQPLAAMTRSAQRVAAGDLQVHVPGSSISEVDALARAFNRMAADLAQADQQRRHSTADIAHELRTPLTIIKGKLEGVLDGVYPATPEHLAPVLEETNLLERLIDDLRTLSLAEAGQLPLHRSRIAVETLFNDVQQSFSAQAAQQQLDLVVEVAPNLPLVTVDVQRMQQVLGNLVANSLRHTSAPGRITLGAISYEHALQLCVQDTGSGIDPADLPHIFDRFWRGDRARSRSGPVGSSSTGLGLAIARQLVEAHGGTIRAASRPNHGTTITIELPPAALHPESLYNTALPPATPAPLP